MKKKKIWKQKRTIPCGAGVKGNISIQTVDISRFGSDEQI